jgi:hypothetical protein
VEGAVGWAVNNSLAGIQGAGVEDHFLLEGGLNGEERVIAWHVDLLLKLLLDQRLKDGHFMLVPVDKNYLVWVDVPQQVNDPLGICVCRKGNVLYLHLDLIGLPVNEYLLGAAQQPIAQSSLHAVARNNKRIFLVAAPLLEHLDAGARV